MSKIGSKTEDYTSRIKKAILHGDIPKLKQHIHKMTITLPNEDRHFIINHMKIKVVEEKRSKWFNLIHYAVKCNHFRIVKYLIEKKRVDINVQSEIEIMDEKWVSKIELDESCLHIASKLGYKNICKLLLDKGINKGILDFNKKYANEVSKNKEIGSLILNFNYLENYRKRKDERESKKDKIFESLIENTDFKIYFYNGIVIHCFKSLLIESKIDLDNVNELNFENDEMSKYCDDINFTINSDKVIKLLIGDDIKLNEDDYFGLFLFFYKLQMKEHVYLCCKKIQKINSTEKLIDLLSKGVKMFDEKDNKKRFKFSSLFNLNIFNILKSKVQNISKVNSYIQKLTINSIDFFSKLKTLKTKGIEKHEYFRNFKFVKGLSFTKLYENTKKTLFTLKKYTNLTLNISDHTNETFLVHREILLINLNFFFSMIKFKGKEYVELNKNNRIEIEILSKDEFSQLLEFVYLGKVKSEDLIVLIRLLEYSDMFFEIKFQRYLLERIKDIFRKLKKKNMLEIEMIKYGYLIDQLHTNLQENILKMFKHLDVKKEKFENLINESVRSNNFIQMILAKNYEHKEKILQLEKEVNSAITLVKNKDKRIKELEDLIQFVKKSKKKQVWTVIK